MLELQVKEYGPQADVRWRLCLEGKTACAMVKGWHVPRGLVHIPTLPTFGKWWEAGGRRHWLWVPGFSHL